MADETRILLCDRTGRLIRRCVHDPCAARAQAGFVAHRVGQCGKQCRVDAFGKARKVDTYNDPELE